MLDANFFDCTRIYKALSAMRKGKVSLESTEVTEEEMGELISLGINIVYDKVSGLCYINSNNAENVYEIISLKSKDAHHVRWAEAGALFAGHKLFDVDAFESFLDETVKRGYKELHFSGDLCAGPVPSGKKSAGLDWTYWLQDTSAMQAEIIVNSLKKFPSLTYYAINGDNEIAFEKCDQINPLILIQRDLQQEGINFNYKPTFVLNLVNHGAVLRIVYLRRKRSYTLSYQSEFYMDEQYAKMVDNVVIKGKTYKIGFVQFGGALENTLNKNGSDRPIYMTTNAGFIRDTLGEIATTTTYPSIRFCDALVQNGVIVGNLKTSVLVK